MTADQDKLLTEKIQAVLMEALRVPAEQVTPELALGDLPQWDSMGHMEVMIVLEQYFGVEINNETIAGLTSIPLIQEYIRSNHNFAWRNGND
jgi:acyl carrier protein